MAVPTVDRGLRTGGALLDGDGGREALDRVDVGLLHLVEELAGVGRETLDVAALTFGVDRVEGEARLAGAREPGDHHQPVPGDAQVEAGEVVFAGPANLEELGARPRDHRSSFASTGKVRSPKRAASAK